jgi:hypothetical protein
VIINVDSMEGLLEVLRDAAINCEEWSCRAPVAHICSEAEYAAERCRKMMDRLQHLNQPDRPQTGGGES